MPPRAPQLRGAGHGSSGQAQQGGAGGATSQAALSRTRQVTLAVVHVRTPGLKWPRFFTYWGAPNRTASTGNSPLIGKRAHILVVSFRSHIYVDIFRAGSWPTEAVHRPTLALARSVQAGAEGTESPAGTGRARLSRPPCDRGHDRRQHGQGGEPAHGGRRAPSGGTFPRLTRTE